MRKKVLFLVAVLVFSMVFPSSLSIGYATEDRNELDISSYQYIHYNGEKQDIKLKEDVVLHLTGWTDESQNAVQGYITDSQGDHATFSIEVSEELQELPTSEGESIFYRIALSSAYKVEVVEPVTFTDSIHVIEKNDNGSSIEEEITVDEYGTIVHKEALTYYKMGENQQKTEITQEEYEALNAVTSPSSSEDMEDSSKPSEETTVEESGQPETPQDSESSKAEDSSSDQVQAPVKAKASLSVQSKVLNPSINYTSYVEGIGWQLSVKDGNLSGTSGESKKLEAMKIYLENAPYSGGVTYKSHVQSYGWMSSVSDGSVSGTTGEDKRLEAIQVSLTGEMANQYDIYYRVHVQTFGWLDWAKNGASAGTEGLSKRVEAIEMKLVEKGATAPGSTDTAFITEPSVIYSTHVQSIGWQDSVADGVMSGTSGQSKRLEGIKIDLDHAPYSGDIQYSTHVQNYGWLSDVSGGNVSGTTGESKRLEAIKIKLTGEMAKHYDVYYRVHAQTYGWLDWAKNGASAGTQGLSKRLEAIEIKLVKKGGKAPGSTSTSFVTKPSVTYSTHVQSYGWLNEVKDGALSGTTGKSKRIEAIKINLDNASFSGDIVYSTNIQDTGWVTNSSNGEISGSVGKSKRLEAIRIELTDDMEKYFDVYYRVHAQSYGWLGWAKNGTKAGTEGLSKRLEAIEIKIFPKGEGPSINSASGYKRSKSVFLDPGHGGSDPGSIGGSYTEAALNLSVAKKVQTLLKARGYTVYMSRTTDTYVSLLDRSKQANALKPDIFVSIHHNSTGASSTTVSGIEAYYYKYYPSYPSKINSDMHNDPDRVMKSTLLANYIQDRLVGYTGATNRGTAGDTFSVLRETAVPATLLELGFINNPTERMKLGSSSYQDKMAKAIVDGIVAYFKKF